MAIDIIAINDHKNCLNLFTLESIQKIQWSKTKKSNLDPISRTLTFVDLVDLFKSNTLMNKNIGKQFSINEQSLDINLPKININQYNRRSNKTDPFYHPFDIRGIIRSLSPNKLKNTNNTPVLFNNGDIEEFNKSNRAENTETKIISNKHLNSCNNNKNFMNNSSQHCDNSIRENKSNNNNDNEDGGNDNLAKLTTNQSNKTVQVENQLSSTVNDLNYRTTEYFVPGHDENKINNKIQTKSNDKTNEEILNTLRQVLRMCSKMDISKRASASEIHQMLEAKLAEFSTKNLEHLRDPQQAKPHEMTNIAEEIER